jgi:fused signal recognition particle receptor
VSFFKKLKSTLCDLVGNNKVANIGDITLEELLIKADFGCALASKIAKDVGREGNMALELRNRLSEIIVPLIREISIDSSKTPYVIVLSGVNGSGKTTTVAKLAFFLKRQGYSVGVAACDTFRAAAVEQLSDWAMRIECDIFKSETSRDPASVAFDAVRTSKRDVLIIDTAGRLHNNPDLMSELKKLYRVIAKLDATAPHMNLLIIDATTGQNAVVQVKEFGKIHPLSGIIVSKVDGCSKGGAIVSVINELQIPIFGVGAGENVSDFESFSVDKFLKDLME